MNSKPLSKSILWEEMQKYYEKLGPNAWSEDLVPYQITSNKLLAHLYATLINAAIYDHINSIGDSSYSEPFYILELGAGHGKFSFYVLKFLESFNEQYKIIYIASDISQQNIDYWQKHPSLQKYIKNHQLDFAKFNPENNQNIYLINSKVTIEKNSLNNPMFVIANYIFDTLPHDAFQCRDNQLFASTIDICNKKAFSFKSFDYKYYHEPIEDNYYNQKVYNQILCDYKQQLKNGSFLLPIGALSAIDNIRLFSKCNTVFLVADKGNAVISDFFDIEEPNIAVHGSISFMVNFHALKTFFELTNGISNIMISNNTDLQIACFITNKTSNSNKWINFTTKHVLYDINPQNLINLCYVDDKIINCKTLDQILAILIISKWDPDLFYDLSDQLINFIDQNINKETLNVEQEQAIVEGLNLVWDCFFKLEKNQDLPFVLANIHYSLENFDLASKFFKISIQEFGETKEALDNIKLCEEALAG